MAAQSKGKEGINYSREQKDRLVYYFKEFQFVSHFI